MRVKLLREEHKNVVTDARVRGRWKDDRAPRHESWETIGMMRAEQRRPLSAPMLRKKINCSNSTDNVNKIIKNNSTRILNIAMKPKRRVLIEESNISPLKHQTKSTSPKSLPETLLRFLNSKTNSLTQCCCSVFDYLKVSDSAKAEIPEEWYKLVMRLYDVILPVVMADPPDCCVSLKENMTADEILSWIDTRINEVKDSMFWRTACTEGQIRETLLGQVASRDFKKYRVNKLGAAKSNAEPKFLSSQTNEMTMRMTMRGWKEYSFRRSRLRMMSENRIIKLIQNNLVKITFIRWRTYSYRESTSRLNCTNDSLLQSLQSAIDNNISIHKQLQKTQYVNREIRSTCDMFEYRFNELENQLTVRSAKDNNLLFDLSKPVTDLDGSILSTGILSFCRPDLSASAVGVAGGNSGSSNVQLDADPDYYTAWLIRGFPTVRRDWIPREVLLLWVNHVIDEAFKNHSNKTQSAVLMPQSVLTICKNKLLKMSSLSGINKGVPHPDNITTIDDLTVDTWAVLLSCVAGRALLESIKETTTSHDHTKTFENCSQETRFCIVWKTLELVGVVQDANQDNFKNKNHSEITLILSKLLLYFVTMKIIPEEDALTRTCKAISVTDPYKPLPNVIPAIKLEHLISEPLLPLKEISENEKLCDAVLLWASHQLQAAQSYSRRVRPLMTNTSEYGVFDSDSINLSADCCEKKPKIKYFWWTDDTPSWDDIEPKYRCTSFSSIDTLWKLVLITQYTVKPYLTDIPLYLPLNQPGNEQQQASYLYECMSIINGNSYLYNPLDPEILSDGDIDVRMMFLVSLFLAAWGRLRHESGGASIIPYNHSQSMRSRKKKKQKSNRKTLASHRQGIKETNSNIEQLSPIQENPVDSLGTESLGKYASEIVKDSSVQISWFNSTAGTDISAEANVSGDPQIGIQLPENHPSHRFVEPNSKAMNEITKVTNRLSPDSTETLLSKLLTSCSGWLTSMYIAYCGNDLHLGFGAVAALQFSKDCSMLSDPSFCSVLSEVTHQTCSVDGGTRIMSSDFTISSQSFTKRTQLSSDQIYESFTRAYEQCSFPITYTNRSQVKDMISVVKKKVVKLRRCLGLTGFIYFLMDVVGCSSEDETTVNNLYELLTNQVIQAKTSSSTVIISQLYSSEGSIVMQVIGNALSDVFEKHSLCPTTTRLLVDRRMSRISVVELFEKVRIIPEVVPEQNFLNQLLFIFQLSTSSPVCQKPSAVSPEASTLDECFIDYAAFTEIVFTLSQSVVRNPYITSVVQFFHFVMHSFLPRFQSVDRLDK